MPKKTVSLYEILPTLEIDYEKYWEGEEIASTQLVQEKGYTTIGKWWTSESDSFGPLCRSLRAIDPEGNEIQIIHG